MHVVNTDASFYAQRDPSKALKGAEKGRKRNNLYVCLEKRLQFNLFVFFGRSVQGRNRFYYGTPGDPPHSQVAHISGDIPNLVCAVTSRVS